MATSYLVIALPLLSMGCWRLQACLVSPPTKSAGVHDFMSTVSLLFNARISDTIVAGSLTVQGVSQPRQDAILGAALMIDSST